MQEKRSLKGYAQVVFAGFAMGVANIIPGVSGGTMAFILGIFEELVDAIGKFASAETLKDLCHLRIKKLYLTLPWQFLLALGIGILLAFACGAKLFTWLLETHQALTFGFFFGLILASILTVYKKVNRWSFANFIFALAGAAAAYAVITLVPVDTPNCWWISFLCGIVVICAMILPGLSGSFLLLILGQYEYVWKAIGNFSQLRFSSGDISTVFWLGLGAVIGLGSFVHLLKFLFARHHDPTICVLIGFMVGSLPRLWPWQTPVEWSVQNASGLHKVTELTPEITAGAVKIKELRIDYFMPDNFDAQFWYIAGLAAFGVILVLVMECFAAAKPQQNQPDAEK